MMEIIIIIVIGNIVPCHQLNVTVNGKKTIQEKNGDGYTMYDYNIP